MRKIADHDPLLEPAWNALETEHAHFAVGDARVRRYPMEVVPFAALANHSADNLTKLGELLAIGEHVYLFGPKPVGTSGIKVGPPLNCYQMLGPSSQPVESGAEKLQIGPMSAKDADTMEDVNKLAFTG